MLLFSDSDFLNVSAYLSRVFTLVSDLTGHSAVKVEFTELEILFASHPLDFLGLLTPCPFISFTAAPNS